MEKPKVKLTGTSSNPFAIIGACIKAAREAGWEQDKIASTQKNLMRGDYKTVLNTAKTFFDVE